uniref:Nicastrin n=1 Tax=Pseudo-nitzschia australis TaxID=44445 RepID=A0A7S4A9P3_9STRA|mmetsp:Transcript_19890/g.43208  ORF Transcript_19890/g.43208 Transcript_19890/m.43208 type:complete len:783 (-) Transcript_19890:204-2552(-)
MNKLRSVSLALLWTFSFHQMAVAQGDDANSSSNKHKSLNEPFQSTFHNLKHSGCTTLYNREGRTGCGTIDRESQSGPIYYYDGSNSVPEDGNDYVAVIEDYYMTAEVINKLVSSNVNGNLKGIMVLNGTDTNDSNEYASPGPKYPLGYGTPSEGISYGDNSYAWNANGDGLVHYDLYGVPMVYINEYESSYYIRNGAQDENKASVIYSEFNYYMGPDGINSKDCLAWVDTENQKWNPKCAPLGGVSVWGFAGSPPPSSDNADNDNSNANAYKPAVVVGTSIDSTSMFHDLVPGSNEGASNVLATIMAAYLLGQSVDDATLDQLPNRIIFGFFEGEAYGYLGSRRFIKDIYNFQCDDQYKVRSVAKDNNSDMACLYPMRPSLKFKDIGEIAAMLTVDQVGVPVGDGNLFVHNSGQGNMGEFLAKVMKYTGTSYYNAVATAAENGNDGYPYPPTPLNSLLSVTGGNVDGAVLTGYDYVFTKRSPYQSHSQSQNTNLKSVASSATIMARTALAAAYDDGEYDYETAATYANNAIPELSYENELLVELANCLFVNGNCKLLNNYASMEAANDQDKTGFDIGTGQALGMPPNYYVGIYHMSNGQPFVKVGSKWYGSYDGEDYGKSKGDSFGMQPKRLQQALRNMLHSFLGKGSSMVDQNGDEVSPRKCSSANKCLDISYCGEDADSATCSADNVCVCQRGFYHIALDEALDPTPNKSTGFFDISSDDGGVSPIWTEPYWSPNVGVKMYRHSDSKAGWYVLAGGFLFSGFCFFVAVLLKIGMKKEKLY